MKRLLFASKTVLKSWIHALEDDFNVLSRVSPKHAGMTGSADWFAAFRRSPHQMRKGIKEACLLPEANRLAASARGPSEVFFGAPWVCDACGKRTGSKQALAVHAFRKHGFVRKARFYADQDAVCHICLLKFGCRGRLIEHLANASPKCMDALLRMFKPLPDDVVAALDASDRATARELVHTGRRRVVATMPCFRLPGPLPSLE